ncbi:hypothetical protein Tco_0320329 [Tanacetum coccineum]
MVATRLHQPWRAILSVLNRCLTGKESRLDTVRLPILQISWVIVHSANLDFVSLIWDEFECDYKFRMEVPDAMISYAIKKKARYTYYMAKKVESEKAKIVDEPEEQHVSPVKSRRGKGFMCYGDQVVNAPNKLKKDVVPRKTRSQKIIEETIVGSSAAHNKYYDSSDNDSEATLYSSSSDKTKESENETDDADEYDMDLFDDNPQGDDDDASQRDIKSSLDFIQTLLDKTPANELTDFMSHLVYTGAQTTSVVHNPEGNPEITSYISGSSKVPLGTHVDILSIKTLLQEMFLNENAHHIPSLPAKKILCPMTTPQPSSLQTKAKKLMQKAKKNMRKINFKKAVAQKFREYDQKLEALTNFNVFEALEKAVQARVLTESRITKGSHDNQDPPNNREGENKKKRRKDVGEPSSRSSRIDFLKAEMSTRTEESLKGRDWTDMDVEKSNEMVDKIDKVLKRREQLRRLEEYVGGRPKTVNPRTFVRPL